MDARDMFMRGREAGKIAPEKDIIRHLKIGRAGSNALLVGGAGLIGAGVYRADQRKKVKKFDQDAYFGGLLAGGGSLALLSAGGKATLKNQSRRWKRRELNSLEMARRSSPNVAPRKTSNAVYGNKSGWKSVTPSQAYAAGLHRGDATQAKYFSMEYRNLARLADKGTKAGIIAGAIGGGALAAGGVKRHLEKGLRPLSIRPRRVTMRAGGLVSRNGKQFTRRGSLG